MTGRLVWKSTPDNRTCSYLQPEEGESGQKDTEVPRGGAEALACPKSGLGDKPPCCLDRGTARGWSPYSTLTPSREELSTVERETSLKSFEHILR